MPAASLVVERMPGVETEMDDDPAAPAQPAVLNLPVQESLAALACRAIGGESPSRPRSTPRSSPGCASHWAATETTSLPSRGDRALPGRRPQLWRRCGALPAHGTRR